jgi:hypothetical protein
MDYTRFRLPTSTPTPRQGLARNRSEFERDAKEEMRATEPEIARGVTPYLLLGWQAGRLIAARWLGTDGLGMMRMIFYFFDAGNIFNQPLTILKFLKYAIAIHEMCIIIIYILFKICHW